MEVKELRTQLGLTQLQLAVKIGVAIATVSRWENEHKKPSPMALARLRQLEKRIKQREVRK